MTYQTGELNIICRAHRRRCSLKPSRPGDPVRIWHEGKARGDELCSSQRFLVRHEREMDRADVLLTGGPHEQCHCQGPLDACCSPVHKQA